MSKYQNMFNLTGKTALVVGGTGGLGSAIAEAYLENGANVIVAGTKPEKVAYLQEIAEKNSVQYLGIKADITDSLSVENMKAEILSIFSQIDILVNCAGMNKLMKAENYDEAAFNQVLGLNINGTHLVCQAIGKEMIKRNYGRIINLSSVKGQLGVSENYLAYCTSKGAINMYTKQLACEWGKYGITVNAIAPTFVRTPINSFQLDDEVFYSTLCERIPLGRIGKEADIAAAAVYLASDAASFVSGHILNVDGGLTARQ